MKGEGRGWSHALRRFALHLYILLCVGLLSAGSCAAAPLVVKDDYRSPRNPERPLRTSTRLIILHTTEAHASSALNKLSERGEAHYCVTEKGEIYRIIDREREAFHAGRSMWNAREDCDEYAIGIEVVGYHDKSMPVKQLEALKQLVDQLKKAYKLQDVQVIAHSHVAYGAPNKWFKSKHRGRKRCGMLFAMPSVRAKLGLKARPAYDPDVKAKRLIQADEYLNEVLYGSRDTMVAVYGKSRPQLRAAPTATGKADPKKPVQIVSAKPAKPKAKSAPAQTKSQLAKNIPAKIVPGKSTAKSNPTAKPQPTKPIARAKPVVPVNPQTAKPIVLVKPAPKRTEKQPMPAAPDEAQAPSRSWLTLIGLKGGYFQKRAKVVEVPLPVAEEVPQPIKTEDPDDEVSPHDPEVKYEVVPAPKGIVIGKMGDDVRDLEMLVKLPGYTRGGPVNDKQTPFKIAGAAWKANTTYYYLPQGKIVRGDQVDEKSIAPGTFIFFKK